jgi:transglutaminase-like putative cysteine protease
MRRSSFLLFVTLILLAASLSLLARSPFVRPDQPVPASRTLAFSYQVHLPAVKDTSGKLFLWIPLPQRDAFEKIQDLQIESPVAHTRRREFEYGNTFLMFEPTSGQLSSGFDVTLRFVATRFEHKVNLDASSAKPLAASTPSTPNLQRYLEPDKLVPLNGIISGLAQMQTAGVTAPLEKARRIYDYDLSVMRYDKSGEGWGRGDAVSACTSKRGNGTDFHSLFIGMMRASSIPARFEIGFPLPETKTEGEIPGYHCWAEFYLDGPGWIPVDASEAWKDPAKRNYFFRRPRYQPSSPYLRPRS